MQNTENMKMFFTEDEDEELSDSSYERGNKIT